MTPHAAALYWIAVDFELTERLNETLFAEVGLGDEWHSYDAFDRYGESVDSQWWPPAYVKDAFLAHDLSHVYLWSYFFAMSLTTGYRAPPQLSNSV